MKKPRPLRAAGKMPKRGSRLRLAILSLDSTAPLWTAREMTQPGSQTRGSSNIMLTRGYDSKETHCGPTNE